MVMMSVNEKTGTTAEVLQCGKVVDLIRVTRNGLASYVLAATDENLDSVFMNLATRSESKARAQHLRIDRDVKTCGLNPKPEHWQT